MSLFLLRGTSLIFFYFWEDYPKFTLDLYFLFGFLPSNPEEISNIIYEHRLFEFLTYVVWSYPLLQFFRKKSNQQDLWCGRWVGTNCPKNPLQHLVVRGYFLTSFHGREQLTGRALWGITAFPFQVDPLYHWSGGLRLYIF